MSKLASRIKALQGKPKRVTRASRLVEAEAEEAARALDPPPASASTDQTQAATDVATPAEAATDTSVPGEEWGLPPGTTGLLRGATFDRVVDAWEVLERLNPRAAIRALALADRFYLLVRLLKRTDAFHPWIYARCREVEGAPDGRLDLWAREHYKSTIITYAGVIQQILRNPEITIGIFSHTKPVAKKFLLQVKLEFEANEFLKKVFPDVLWGAPEKEAPRWSEDNGLIVRRKTNPKEATLEAHGLVDGQPIGAHYLLRVYDDVVTDKSVGTPEQISKTTNAFRLSDNLGARGPDGRSRVWAAGTRYSFGDTYQTMIEEKILTPRIYPATDDGTPDGEPVFLSPEVWEEKKRTQGPAVIAAQMLLNPTQAGQAMFRKEWLRYADVRPSTLNVYIMVDPASSRKKGTDRTAIAAVGVDAANNFWFLDGYRHKMNLEERWLAMRDMWLKWVNMNGIQRCEVGYERYGMTSDLEYFEEKMRLERRNFEIRELAWPREGHASKFDRIQRLVPWFMNGKFYIPEVVIGESANQKRVKEGGESHRIYSPVRRRDENGEFYYLNKVFLEEFLVYPYVAHDDMLDVVSRIFDMEPVPAVVIDERLAEPEVYVDGI